MFYNVCNKDTCETFDWIINELWNIFINNTLTQNPILCLYPLLHFLPSSKACVPLTAEEFNLRHYSAVE